MQKSAHACVCVCVCVHVRTCMLGCVSNPNSLDVSVSLDNLIKPLFISVTCRIKLIKHFLQNLPFTNPFLNLGPFEIRIS